MSTGVIYLRPMLVMRVRGYGQNRDAARTAWSKMFAWADASGFRPHAVRAFGLVYKVGEQVDRATYDACVELNDDMVAKIPEGFDTTVIPSGAYLRQRLAAPLEEIGTMFRKLRVEEAVSRGLMFDAGKPMIEVYLNDFVRRGIEPKIDLCVPVRT